MVSAFLFRCVKATRRLCTAWSAWRLSGRPSGDVPLPSQDPPPQVPLRGADYPFPADCCYYCNNDAINTGIGRY